MANPPSLLARGIPPPICPRPPCSGVFCKSLGGILEGDADALSSCGENGKCTADEVPAEAELKGFGEAFGCAAAGTRLNGELVICGVKEFGTPAVDDGIVGSVNVVCNLAVGGVRVNVGIADEVGVSLGPIRGGVTGRWLVKTVGAATDGAIGGTNNGLGGKTLGNDSAATGTAGGPASLFVSIPTRGIAKGVVTGGLVSANCTGFTSGCEELQGGAGVAAASDKGVIRLPSSDFFSGVTIFLSFNFAMASASRSCFSHFENDRYAAFGLPVRSLAIAEATRRPGELGDCWKGLIRRPTFVEID